MLHILNNIKKRGEVKHMKRKTFRKSLAVVLSIILAMSVIVQNVSLVYGEELVYEIDIPTSRPGNFETKTFTIPDLFRITSVINKLDTNNETDIDYYSNGNSVTIDVQGNNVKKIGDKSYVYPLKITYTKNIAPKLEIESPSTSQNLRYCGLKLTQPKGSGYIEIKGTVTDQNAGEKIKLFYLIDKYSNENTQATAVPTGSPIATTSPIPATSSPSTATPTVSATPIPTPTPMNFQASTESSQSEPFTITSNGGKVSFICYVPIHTLPEGQHKLFIWAEDEVYKKPETPMAIISFYNDKTSPENPIIRIEPDKPTYAKSVKVTIEAPSSDPSEKITTYYYLSEENINKLYNKDNPIIVTKNQTVVAACYDQVGLKSDYSILTIKNIDNEPPEAPTIEIIGNTTVTDAQIKFTIKHGIDKVIDFDSGKEIEGPIQGSEYSYDKGVKWILYDDYKGGEILPKDKVGTFKIWARTIDQAGNKSEIIESEEVTIKSSKPAPTSAPSNSGGGSSSGGSIIYVPPVQVESPSPSTTSEPVTTPPLELPSPTPIPIPADLGVFLTSDKTAYEENSTVTFSVYYNNKLTTPAENVVIKAEIPKDIIVVDAANGTVSGYTISWNIGTLDGKATGQIIFKLKIGKLSTSEVALSSKVTISSANQMTNTDDDESIFNFIGFSKNIAGELHTKFINGYENKQFRPDNMITRAEVAKILVTALSLEKTEGTENKFKDVDSKHWAYDYINIAVENGIFSGYGDGTFSPNKAITRAELSTALAKYLKLKNIDPAEVHFNDISNHWAKNYIEEIYRLKLIAGYSDGTFKPDAQIKRSECVTIICRLLNRGPLNNADAGFTDVSKTHWAYGYIAEGSLDHNYTRNSDGSETLVKK